MPALVTGVAMHAEFGAGHLPRCMRRGVQEVANIEFGALCGHSECDCGDGNEEEREMKR